MNTQLVDAIRSLHLREGHPHMVEVDGSRYKIWIESTADVDRVISPDAEPDLVPPSELMDYSGEIPSEVRRGKEIPFDPPVITDEDREGLE